MDGWIRRFHRAPDAPVQLLCFPHAGGAAGAQHALSAAVAGPLEPVVVQYPGRHDRFTEPFAERIDEVVDAVLDALPADPAGRPLALFGHSMGALAAFETARALQARGRAPAALFVSGHPGPSLPIASYWPGAPSDDELLAEMRLLAGTDDSLLADPMLLEVALPALRADYAMLSAYSYRPGPPLRCPVVALTGDADPRVRVEEMPTWRQETLGPFTTHVLPGGHFYLDDHLPRVARALTSVFART
ncbi:alpha/beta fold hydrolase [Streptomyces sp. SID486]|uniref:thioesterase II family protein n=1 Tax=unclassified Streptomyces TaxID=2593676 RepID=UPI001369B226|nr:MULTISPECIES: alpha/beta fold hydrolase [unclassified Streptomyces]MYW46507.1 alpha/beta fold hydrolase [Streptomyces sp. SID161]MYX95117.1 alpha/beta fold hydrolase [Streptomyces sp. SID486]